MWGGTAISFLFILFRVYVRMKAFHKFYADDFFVLLSWLLLLATAIIWQFVSSGLYQMLAVESGHLFPLPATFSTDSEKYLRSSVPIIAFFYTGLWSVKLSFLLFFRRLGNKVRGQKLHWWIVTGFTVATWCTCIGSIQYNCLVPSFEKIVRNCRGLGVANFQSITVKFNCAMDVLTDAMGEKTICGWLLSIAHSVSVISIPITMLVKVRINMRQKLALAAIFSLVVITMVFAIVRVATQDSLTVQPEQTWLYMWGGIENTVGMLQSLLQSPILTATAPKAIIIVCLASFRSIFIRQEPHSNNLKQYITPRERLLPGSRALHKSQPTGRSSLHSGTTTINHSKVNGSSEENIVPPKGIAVRHDLHTNSEAPMYTSL